MLRSLHMKLVLIMTLLIVSLMTVVGAFLINSVSSFYMKEFHDSMYEAFSRDSANSDLWRDLTTASEEEHTDAERVKALRDVLVSYNGKLGVDGRNRKFYILSEYGKYLAGSDNDGSGANLTTTHNLASAINGNAASEIDVSANYMDAAFPITRGGSSYIIYILDNRQTAQNLSTELIRLVVQSLGFGLVISILLSFLLAKTMITPIEKLTDGAERVAEGDFSHKIAVASRDEIGVLTGTFNAMARQLQETLQEVENERNKLGTLFLHMTDGVVAFSRDGAVIQSNPAAEEMLGRSIPVGGEETYDSLFGDIAPLGEVLSVEQPGYVGGARELDGRSMELLLAPFSGEGQGGAMVVIHDVTEQHRTEALRREFVANVSHELRTPLTNIRSYAETLVDSAGDLPPQTEKNFLGVILGESDRMTHIVQDLLTLSRFDSGFSELNLTRFSFEGAVRDVYNAVLMEAQRHGHALRMQAEAGLPEILADRERIVQVMMNVVSNAIKYTPDGGSIRITAGRAGEKVWMEVADNGIGIPEEDRPRIFERFYRVDKARSRESGGTGLGLSIAKEIIERHRGAIGLVDREGPGLTVRIELLVEGPGHGAA